MQTRAPFCVFKAMLLSGALAAYVLGQANTASIRGTVADSSGAVVPHAKILLTNTGTGVQVTDQTNDAGEYVFQFLPPGSYRVETEVNGFKKFVRENIVLDLGRQLRIDVSLEPGQITQTVDVASTGASGRYGKWFARHHRPEPNVDQPSQSVTRSDIASVAFARRCLHRRRSGDERGPGPYRPVLHRRSRQQQSRVERHARESQSRRDSRVQNVKQQLLRRIW